MCGLIMAKGSYSDGAMLEAMGSMSYRGRDSLCGLVEFKGWKMGHVRLAIQDLTDGGAQPFRADDEFFETLIWDDAHIAFVGEFFSYDSDYLTEQQYCTQLVGSQDFHRFHEADGFWSVGLLGGHYSTLIFTDHLGIKPVYYWPEKDIACSEIEPMFKLANRPELDEVYLANCVKWGYDCTGRTPWKGIWQLGPGKVLNLRAKRIRTYWHWDRVSTAGDLRSKVMSAIVNRLIGNREVGLLLSGGLDSSIIYYSLQHMGFNVRAFSYPNGENEFLPDGVQALEIPELVDDLEAMRIMQAPLDLGSLFPQIALSRAVRATGLNVIMSGDGADELFGGYTRAQVYDSQKSDVFCELPYYHHPRLDRVNMRETIELRTPYTSPAVVAHALKLPWKERTSKQALKRAFEDIVPDFIIGREKKALKSSRVIEGGMQYRQQLVEAFREQQAHSEGL